MRDVFNTVYEEYEYVVTSDFWGCVTQAENVKPFKAQLRRMRKRATYRKESF